MSSTQSSTLRFVLFRNSTAVSLAYSQLPSKRICRHLLNFFAAMLRRFRSCPSHSTRKCTVPLGHEPIKMEYLCKHVMQVYEQLWHVLWQRDTEVSVQYALSVFWGRIWKQQLSPQLWYIIIQLYDITVLNAEIPILNDVRTRFVIFYRKKMDDSSWY